MNMDNNHQPYEIIGDIENSDILIIADHASNIVPTGIDLGIHDDLLNNHIAVDIGVKRVSELMTQQPNIAAIMATQSRLVIDLNREEDDESLIPLFSDDHMISGNVINDEERMNRIKKFFRPYHDKISECIQVNKPKLILSLHSFTPSLKSDPDKKRPWDIGVLYGEHEATSKLAIKYLLEAGLMVGDQLPYSGKILNATMNQHAEARNISYFGVEMRQDLVVDENGCERFAQILTDSCFKITKKLAM